MKIPLIQRQGIAHNIIITKKNKREQQLKFSLTSQIISCLQWTGSNWKFVNVGSCWLTIIGLFELFLLSIIGLLYLSKYIVIGLLSASFLWGRGFWVVFFLS